MNISKNVSEFEAALANFSGPVPNAEEYNRISSIFIEDPLVEEMKGLDPFSAEYRSAAMQLYLTLRRRSEGGYVPESDERSGAAGLVEDIWRQSSPWSFRSPSMASEFLICWGHIMKLMDLPNESTASILEYGTGSGQFLLFLARMGLDVHAVDIDQPSLDLVSAQAHGMGLNVKCERALFGEGFDGEKFDRIIFFEAFHHAWNFEALLDRLAERLNPGGLLILCGEPVVSQTFPGIPFAWGPRLDGLSVFCIRNYGWMELGFTQEFLTEVFHRRGWLLSDFHINGIPRASTYVARRALGSKVKLGDHISLGQFASEWDAPEGTHRWTRGGTSRFPNPNCGGDVIIRFSNMLPVKKLVSFKSGDSAARLTVPAGATGYEVTLRRTNSRTIDIECEGHRPIDLGLGSDDARILGIAVSEVEFS